MAIAYVKSGADSGTSITSLSEPFASAVSAGSLLCFGARIGALGRTVTVSDSVNGSWTFVNLEGHAAAGHEGHLWYFQNSAAGTPTVTVAISGAISSIRMAFAEYTGAATAAALVAENSGQGDVGAGVRVSSGTVATTADYLLFGAGTNANDAAGTWTAANSGGTWNNRQSIGGGANPLMIADIVLAAGGDYEHNPSFSGDSAGYTSHIAMFQPPPATTLPPLVMAPPIPT